MRTLPVIGVILALGFAFTLVAGAGIGPAVYGENPGDSPTTKTIDDIGKEADVGEGEDGEGGVSADVGGDDEPTLRGFGLSGAELAIKVVGAIAFLPSTLMGLGFPEYFATPAGRIAQFIGTVGIFQFIRVGVFD